MIIVSASIDSYFKSELWYYIDNMKICDVLDRRSILPDLKARNKKGILEELVVPVAEIAGVNQEGSDPECSWKENGLEAPALAAVLEFPMVR